MRREEGVDKGNCKEAGRREANKARILGGVDSG